MFISPEEREVGINWREVDREVEIWTTSPMWKERFERMGFDLKVTEEDRGEPYAWAFFCLLKDFRIGKKKKLNLSEEQRAKLRERAKRTIAHPKVGS